MKNFTIAMVIVITFLFSGSALAGGGFEFKVTFNQNGELIRIEHDNTTADFPGGFHDEHIPLKNSVKRGKGILMQKIPIDLKLLLLDGDDPCITHKGRRYCW